MGKRVAGGSTKTTASESFQQFTPPLTRTKIRKRKYNVTAAAPAAVKSLRLNATSIGFHHNYSCHENDDEDSSSNDCPAPAATAAMLASRNQSSKQGNNSSILLNSSLDGGESTAESPKPVYSLRPSVVNGTILYDLASKPWRLGRPIGKGNFGEIFLASDNITIPVTNETAKFVVKIEPHSNGPLFVEIHCLMSTARKKPATNDEEYDDSTATAQLPPSGIPDYIASGSHYFGDARYRFLVLPRFDRDLHTLVKNCRVHQKSVLTLAIQIVNVLENLHDKGYCHNDVKAQNLMISKCQYFKRKLTTTTTTTPSHDGKKVLLCHTKKYDDHYEEKQPTTDSGNSSEQEANDDNVNENANFIVKRNGYSRVSDDEEEDDEEEDDDEDFDDGATSHSNSNNSSSLDPYRTPINRHRKGRPRKNIIEFSGSNPVRNCRRQKRNSIYEEMVKSHYLRPAKRISYSEFFNEDAVSLKDAGHNPHCSSGEESDEFIPRSARRSNATASASKKSAGAAAAVSTRLVRRLTRRQERVEVKRASNTITTTTVVPELVPVEEERIFLIDFGLASKFMDNNGIHRPFVMDQRRAHDGTLEFTSRDAHMGAHSRRSDLECLGYNLLYWSQGYLPWKEVAQQHQQEKVHRAKEYLMTDVRELLKQIYGKQIPKYLGEFLHQVGQLAYHERPDYARYRRIFEREFQQLGYTLSELRLDNREIVRTCVRHDVAKDEMENKDDVFDVTSKISGQNAWSIMNNLSVGTPFQERTLSNRVSPKNLRSKSDKKTLKKKKFSWAEVLSQDPDQIARERAEKEFDREEELSDVQQPVVRRYQGRPTYAILEIQRRLRLSGRLIESHEPRNTDLGEVCKEEVSDEADGGSDDEEAEEEEDEENGEEDDQMDVSVGSEEDEANEEGDDIDSDGTEVSSEQQHPEHSNGHANQRKRKGYATQQARAATKTSAPKKSALKAAKLICVEQAPIGRKRGRPKGSTNRKKVEFTTRTRSSASSTTSGAATVAATKAKKNKRGSATRNGRVKPVPGTVGYDLHAASAAGECEQSNHLYHRLQHNTLRYYNHNSQRSENGQHGGIVGSVLERRKRRCLIKTDEADAEMEDEESNSNYSPVVSSLLNAWKKLNEQQETIYFRGNGAATTARHFKK